jgi:hypothetical protein
MVDALEPLYTPCPLPRGCCDRTAGANFPPFRSHRFPATLGRIRYP